MKRSIAIWGLLFVFIANNLQAVPTDDETYADRLASLRSDIPLTYNHKVRQYIDAYLKNPDSTARIIARSWHHEAQTLTSAIAERELPKELMYLPMAASGADFKHRDEMGSSGLWEMRYNVARRYGLKINTFVDERRDPALSSKAAVGFLSDLHFIYRDWSLAIAAFGSSSINVNKAIRLADNKKDFWQIYEYLPPATRDLLPKFIAAVYIASFYKEHNIQPVKLPDNPPLDSVQVNNWLSFSQISKALVIDSAQLEQLNPAFRKGVIPLSKTPYRIALPEDKAANFAQLKDSVYKPVAKPTNLDPVAVTKPKKSSGSSSKRSSSAPSGKTKVYYKVKQGDVLGFIADYYDVGVSQVRAWNGLRGSFIKAGQTLVIYVPSSKLSYYKRINTMSASQRRAIANKD